MFAVISVICTTLQTIHFTSIKLLQQVPALPKVNSHFWQLSDSPVTHYSKPMPWTGTKQLFSNYIKQPVSDDTRLYNINYDLFPADTGNIPVLKWLLTPYSCKSPTMTPCLQAAVSENTFPSLLQVSQSFQITPQRHTRIKVNNYKTPLASQAGGLAGHSTLGGTAC